MKRERGFTLIELAIVLVIIGIIIGMVLKGQDLVENARIKKFVNDSGRKWETAMWICFDRVGKFPGDTDANGLIDTDPLSATCTDASCTCIQNLQGTPERNISGLYVYVGVDGSTNGKNIIVICGDAGCANPLGTDKLNYARAFDSAYDGTTDDRAGLVRGATAVTIGTSGAVTSVTIPDTATDTTTDWDADDVAIVYYFDRKP